MKINMTINEQPTIVEATPDERLSVLLRKLKYFSIKSGCNTGFCGECSILLDGKVISSCIIPVAAARNSKIITLEYFIKTEYGEDIKKAFTECDVTLCGYCDAQKYFAIYELLQEHPRPTREISYKTVSSFSCHCIDSESMINVINKTASLMRSRTRGLKYGQK